MPLTEPTRLVLRKGWQPMDPDAATYITAVETADGQALEEPVKIAIDNFVLGCKADGIWPAIKASCILAGARTLSGALTPLVGTAPTNNNFVAGDYNRETGLVGDGSTKYLNSNRNNNSDPQDSHHLSAFITSAQGGTLFNTIIGADAANETGRTILAYSAISPFGILADNRSVGRNATQIGSRSTTGFVGHSRNSSASYIGRLGGVNTVVTSSSGSIYNADINVFRRSAGDSHTNASLAFYSIGESLDLALLDARVTDLINKFAEVIP